MDEAVCASEVHERAEAADAGYYALAGLAFLQLLDELGFEGVPGFLYGLSLREDGAVAAAVDLQHLHLEVFADFGVLRLLEGHLLLLGQALVVLLVEAEALSRHGDELGHRHEALYALDLHDGAAAVESGDLSLDHLAGVHRLFEVAPALFADGSVYGQDGGAVARLGAHHHGDDGSADQAVHVGGVHGAHLVGGDVRFGLLSDVDEESVGRVGAHYDAFDDVSSADVFGFAHHFFEQLPHVLFGWSELLVLFSSHCCCNFRYVGSGRSIICNDMRLVKPPNAHRAAREGTDKRGIRLETPRRPSLAI